MNVDRTIAENGEKSKKFSSDNLLYDGADHVVKAESAHIKGWRGREPLVGLTLSGGGIRSATYCLGVLQAMAYKRVLPNVDYLSTVSGGGYIGASLSYLLQQSASGAVAGLEASAKFDVSRENFPYVSYPMVGVGVRASRTHAGQPPDITDERLGQNENFKGRLLRRLRQSTNYLVPGDGISFLSLGGVVLRNLMASVVAHVALLVLLFQFLFYVGAFDVNQHLEAGQAMSRVDQIRPGEAFAFPASNIFLVAAAALVGFFGGMSVLYVVLTRLFDSMAKWGEQWPYGVRRAYDVATHILFVAAIASAVIGALPWVHELLARLGLSSLSSLSSWLDILSPAEKSRAGMAGALATLIGVIGNVWGFLQARSGKNHLIPTGLVVGVASALLFFGVVLLVFMLTRTLNLNLSAHPDATIFAGAGLVLVLIGWVPEANYVSLHRFYRDRLLELFLPDLKIIQERMLKSTEYQPLHIYLRNAITDRFKAAYTRVTSSCPGDTTMLADLCRPPRDETYASPEEMRLRGPYHIINSNIVLVSSQHPRYRPRGGDNFILSPLYCGSRATGWKPTDRSPGNGFTLATAMAISGAAVNPNAGPGGTGVTRQPVLSVLMGLLNLRLGYWAGNPKKALSNESRSQGLSWVKPNLVYPGMFESFGRINLNEYARYSLLTDGGHFENLGLYELVRRRLKLIVVCDATADPDFKFTDLANAVQKVRADFGAIIDIDAEQLSAMVPGPPDKSHKAEGAGSGEGASAMPQVASRGYLMVPIRYSLRVGQDPEVGREVGTLILLKATFFKGLPADLYSYRRDHPEFPNQGTTDQFFDEKQFDAYRELGYKTAYQMLSELAVRTSESPATATYQTQKGYQAPSEHAVANLLFGQNGQTSRARRQEIRRLLLLQRMEWSLRNWDRRS